MTNLSVQPPSDSRYRPIITLDQGGMADVTLSLVRGPSGFNKLVVLKTMRKELAADADLRQMFLAEGRLSARLNHANVVQVYEAIDAALPCMVLEYLDGQTMSALRRALPEKFTLPMQLRVISDLLVGLHYAHELRDYDGSPLNIVHRDVSPENVFLTYDGQVTTQSSGPLARRKSMRPLRRRAWRHRQRIPKGPNQLPRVVSSALPLARIVDQ